MKRSHPVTPATHLHAGEHRPAPGSPQRLQDEIERNLRHDQPHGYRPKRAASPRLAGLMPSAGQGRGGKRKPRITLPKVGK